MSNVKSEKYGFVPEDIEKESLKTNVFRMKYDFHRLLKVQEDADRKKKIGEKIGIKIKRKLKYFLEIGDNFIVLLEQLKQKYAPGIFLKAQQRTNRSLKSAKSWRLENKQK